MTSFQEILKAISFICLCGQAITQWGFVHLKYKLVKCPWNYKPVFLIQLGNIQHYFQHPVLWMAQWRFRLQHSLTSSSAFTPKWPSTAQDKGHPLQLPPLQWCHPSTSSALLLHKQNWKSVFTWKKPLRKAALSQIAAEESRDMSRTCLWTA